MTSTEVVVGRIGRAHGVKGELSVEPRTDEPERRFAPGAVLGTETPSGAKPHGPDRPATLTIEAIRWHQGRLLVRFGGIADRNRAEAVRGLLLVATVDADEVPEDPEEFYDHQLVGLRVATTEGRDVGQLAEIVHGSAQDLLVVTSADGHEVLVPFVRELVPVVDVRAGRIEIADRPGLLAPLEEPAPDRQGGA